MVIFIIKFFFFPVSSSVGLTRIEFWSKGRGS